MRKLPRTDAHQGRTLLERIVLFILGAGFGALIGFRIVVTAQTPLVFFGGITLAAVLVGALSARYGMDFWDILRHRWWLS